MEKVNPYLRLLYDVLFDLMGAEKLERLIEREIVEVAPFALCVVVPYLTPLILDEAQNTTAEQMKMFLTRIGMGSKVAGMEILRKSIFPSNRNPTLKKALRFCVMSMESRSSNSQMPMLFDTHW